MELKHFERKHFNIIASICNYCQVDYELLLALSFTTKQYLLDGFWRHEVNIFTIWLIYSQFVQALYTIQYTRGTKKQEDFPTVLSRGIFGDTKQALLATWCSHAIMLYSGFKVPLALYRCFQHSLITRSFTIIGLNIAEIFTLAYQVESQSEVFLDMDTFR